MYYRILLTIVFFFITGCTGQGMATITLPAVEATSTTDCLLPLPVQLVIERNPTATLDALTAAVHTGWAVLSTIHRVEIVPVPDSTRHGQSVLLVQWTGPLLAEAHQAPSSLSLLWRMGQEGWQQQTFCNIEQTLLDARLSSGENGVELVVVVDRCVGATSACPQLLLYQYVDALWVETWSSIDIAAWQSAHGSVHFPDDGIATILVHSSSWYTAEADEVELAKQQIFHEANAGPHRWFSTVWQRHGDGYAPIARFTEPSAYNTLVEFIYALQNGGDTAIWVSSPWIIAQAREMGVAELPPKLVPVLTEGEAMVTHGPITIATAEETLVFSFIERSGRILLDQIDQLID